MSRVLRAPAVAPAWAAPPAPTVSAASVATTAAGCATPSAPAMCRPPDYQPIDPGWGFSGSGHRVTVCPWGRHRPSDPTDNGVAGHLDDGGLDRRNIRQPQRRTRPRRQHRDRCRSEDTVGCPCDERQRRGQQQKPGSIPGRCRSAQLRTVCGDALLQLSFGAWRVGYPDASATRACGDVSVAARLIERRCP